MKIIKISFLSFFLVLTIIATGLAQKKKKQKSKTAEIEALKLYEGPELPAGEIVRLLSEPVGKKYAYFIAVDDTSIPNRSLMIGPQEILLLPGDHKIQMRFVSRGEIAIPVEPFESFTFEAGKSYHVKFQHTAGPGNYIDSAAKTRIRIWIEEEGKMDILLEKIVDGVGRSVGEMK